MHNIKDWMWLAKYRLSVRLGNNPLTHKNGTRRYLTRIGHTKIASFGNDSFAALNAAVRQPRFFIARLGYTEARTFGTFRQYQLGLLKEYPQEWRDHASASSGIFTNDDNGLTVFCETLAENLGYVTHMCVFSTEYEPLLIGHYANRPVLVNARALEHFWSSDSWMSGLRGKKVLVISMFADTIISQYQKRFLLFPSNPSATPSFAKLITFKPEVTYSSEKPKFKNWITTLQYMFEKCMQEDFDVAIVSCGGYGLPLGGMLYRAGKNVIHAGGITQVYFGIYGERYTKPPYDKLINESWVRPGQAEQIHGFKTIENGAYW